MGSIDVATVGELYVAHQYRLRSYAISILQEQGGVSYAEDVVHEAFAWLLDRIKRGVAVADTDAATGQLFRAVKNFALQVMWRTGLMVPRHVKTARAVATADLVIGHFPVRIDDYETAERRANLLAAARQLPRRERDVWLRCDCRGDSHGEAADELGMRKQQVALTLYKARNRLAWHIEHGSRPYYAKGATGLRKQMVRSATISAQDAYRRKLAHNRANYSRRSLAHA